jgi:hypothetical protein
MILADNPTAVKVVVEAAGGAVAWVESVPVVERWKGSVAWEGRVEVFDVKGGSVPRAYTWERTEDDGRRTQVVVLHRPPVDSPAAAVRASIVAEFEAKKKSPK